MYISKTNKIFDALISGKSLTPGQIATRYKLANPWNPVHTMRNEGIAIVSNPVVTRRGKRTVRYSFPTTL